MPRPWECSFTFLVGFLPPPTFPIATAGIVSLRRRDNLRQVRIGHRPGFLRERRVSVEFVPAKGSVLTQREQAFQDLLIGGINQVQMTVDFGLQPALPATSDSEIPIRC